MSLPSVTTSTFTLKKSGDAANVAAVVFLGTDGKTATLNPNADLTPGATYTATITTGVKDLAGNAMTAPKAWSFAVAPSPQNGTVVNLPVTAITASGNDGNMPANAFDNNLATRWSNNGLGSWIQADLGSPKAISYVDIAWYRGTTRTNTFDISVSNDGIAFTNVFHGKNSLTVNGLERYDFADSNGRFVRVTVTGNTANNYASINEIDVYGYAQKDSDGDGLLDAWEQTGIDTNGDGATDLNLQAAGADPLHKDLFVEADYMELHKPKADALTHLVAAFANAPITNPDNRQGINLHIQVDDQIPHQDQIFWETLVGPIKDANFGTSAQRSDTNRDNILAAKSLVYRYALFAHNYCFSENSCTTSSGLGGGDNFMVTLGSWAVDPETGHGAGNIEQQESAFMHELGHSLNLGHGGGDGTNHKPNYLSVMNYLFNFPSLIPDRPLDYSRCVLPPLNENSLSEPNGIGTSCPPGLRTVYGPEPILITPTGVPVDWNRDGDIRDTGIGVDINLDNGPSILNGYGDWANLQVQASRQHL